MRFNDSFYMVRRVKVCFLTTHPVLSVNTVESELVAALK